MDKKQFNLIIKLDIPQQENSEEGHKRSQNSFKGINLYEFENNGHQYSQYQTDIL